MAVLHSSMGFKSVSLYDLKDSPRLRQTLLSDLQPGVLACVVIYSIVESAGLLTNFAIAIV